VYSLILSISNPKGLSFGVFFYLEIGRHSEPDGDTRLFEENDPYERSE